MKTKTIITKKIILAAIKVMGLAPKPNIATLNSSLGDINQCVENISVEDVAMFIVNAERSYKQYLRRNKLPETRQYLYKLRQSPKLFSPSIGTDPRFDYGEIGKIYLDHRFAMDKSNHPSGDNQASVIKKNVPKKREKLLTHCPNCNFDLQDSAD